VVRAREPACALLPLCLFFSKTLHSNPVRRLGLLSCACRRRALVDDAVPSSALSLFFHCSVFFRSVRLPTWPCARPKTTRPFCATSIVLEASSGVFCLYQRTLSRHTVQQETDQMRSCISFFVDALFIFFVTWLWVRSLWSGYGSRQRISTSLSLSALRVWGDSMRLPSPRVRTKQTGAIFLEKKFSCMSPSRFFSGSQDSQRTIRPRQGKKRTKQDGHALVWRVISREMRDMAFIRGHRAKVTATNGTSLQRGPTWSSIPRQLINCCRQGRCRRYCRCRP
jgi:hypothetical protein